MGKFKNGEMNMDGTDVAVGMAIQFRDDYGSVPAAAIVTAVGSDRISCTVFYEGFAQGDARSGVMHSSNKDARRQIELNDDAGIWDYAERCQPQEIDKSKEVGKRLRKRETVEG
jgi:hypothetical protein